MEYRREMDSGILTEIKDKIQKYLEEHGVEDVRFLRQNMDEIKHLYAEQSDTKRLPKMQQRAKTTERQAPEIMVRKDFFVDVDENDNPMGFKEKIKKLITSQLGHELIHAASRYGGYSGLAKSIIYIAINEACTQAIIERIFEYTVSPHTDSYKDIKKIAKIFMVTLGEDVILKTYFNHTDDLKKECEKLSGETNYYEDLSICMLNLLSLQRGKTLKQINLNVDSYYDLMTAEVSANMKKFIYKKICAETIIPKIKSLPVDKRKKYIEDVLMQLEDDRVVIDIVVESIEEYAKMSPEELKKLRANINNGIVKQIEKASFIRKLYTTQDYNELLTIDSEGRVFKNGNPPVEITDESIVEFILAHEHYRDMGYNTPEKKAEHEERIAERIEKNGIFQSGMKTKLQVKKSMAAAKVAARNKGYIITNKLNECENMQPVKLDIVKIPSEGTNLSFEELRKIFEEYAVDYDGESADASSLVVRNRATGEVINDPTMRVLARYANLWVSSTGFIKKFRAGTLDEEQAFNEDKRGLYTEFSRLINEQISESGSFDVAEICKKISAFRNNSEDREFVYAIFGNADLKSVVYEYYRLQNPDAMLEIEVGKTTMDVLNEKVKFSSEVERYSLGNMEPYFPGAHDTKSYIRATAELVAKSINEEKKPTAEKLLKNALHVNLTVDEVKDSMSVVNNDARGKRKIDPGDSNNKLNKDI